VDPWRPVRDVTDEEALALVDAIRPGMLRSAQHGFQARDVMVYDRAGRPCPRCGGRIRARGQGDDNRTTFWCPACQT